VHGVQLPRRGFNAVFLQDLECTHTTATTNGSAHFNERMRAIAGSLRALRKDGVLVIAFPRTACTREEFHRFCTDALPRFGCEVLKEWTGEGRSQESDNEGDAPFRMFTVVARKLGDRTRDQIQEHVQPDSLRFTHQHWWPEGQERSRLENEDRRRRLPYSLVHTAFEVGEHAFATNIVLPACAQQLDHLRALEQAVEVIRNLAPNAREFTGLPQLQKNQLSQQGIEYLPQLPRTRSRPAFRLTARPDYLFYPYDRQWNPT